MMIFITGCSCEYNLTIDDDTYKENIIVTGLDPDEIIEFNNAKEIPVDKNNYTVELEDSETEFDTYKYVLTGNNYLYDYSFDIYNYSNSTAVSNCFKTLVAEEYEEDIIISTSTGATCFDKYPNLDNLVVNITVDREVESNNADKVNGKTYTWYINRDNASDKSINMILNNEEVIDESVEDVEPIIDVQETDIYTPNLYIFAAILLVVFLIVYAIVYAIKSKDDYIDERIDDNISDENDE
jgi:hypothetical protein